MTQPLRPDLERVLRIHADSKDPTVAAPARKMLKQAAQQRPNAVAAKQSPTPLRPDLERLMRLQADETNPNRRAEARAILKSAGIDLEPRKTTSSRRSVGVTTPATLNKAVLYGAASYEMGIPPRPAKVKASATAGTAKSAAQAQAIKAANKTAGEMAGAIWKAAKRLEAQGRTMDAVQLKLAAGKLVGGLGEAQRRFGI